MPAPPGADCNAIDGRNDPLIESRSSRNLQGIGVQSYPLRPGRLGQGRLIMASIKTLVLEYMDREGAAHIRDPPIKHEYCVV